jgi:Xaa-Pro aminopeptidase
LQAVDEIREALAKNDLDAAVVISPRNLWCLTGYPRVGQRPGYRRSACGIAYPDAEPTLVTGRFQEEISLIRAWVRDVTAFADYVESPLAKAAAVLRKRGLASGRIGIESRYLVKEFYQDLIDELDEGVEVVSCDDLLDNVWSVKQLAEVRLMKQALEKGSNAIAMALDESEVGETEESVHKRILAAIRRGGSGSCWGRVASGERVSVPNALPGLRELSQGDLVRIEYSWLLRTYPARVSRMGVVGKASAEQDVVYARYIQAVKSAVAGIQPGQSGSAVFALLGSALEEAGFRMVGSSAGHALGIGFHERPRLHAHEEFQTRPRTILCVEPETAEGYKISLEVELMEHTSSVLSSSPLPRIEQLLTIST